MYRPLPKGNALDKAITHSQAEEADRKYHRTSFIPFPESCHLLNTLLSRVRIRLAFSYPDYLA